MFRYLPFSFIFFAATGIVFVLQAFPTTGVFLMFLAAMGWSAVLVNLGMIGTAVEALSGRKSRWWLILPVAFYCGYWVIAAQDRLMLRSLTASYDAANAAVATAFDPSRHALVFENHEDVVWFARNYDVPVVYLIDSDAPEGYASYRLMDDTVCAKVRDDSMTYSAADIRTHAFWIGDRSVGQRLEKRFCVLSMPEKPALPPVLISRGHETKTVKGALPVTLVTTAIGMPDGRRFEVIGGVAAPLKWVPMPLMGCSLISSRASWECAVGFWRDGFTPIVSGTTRYHRNAEVVATALGLKPVTSFERHVGDPKLVLEKIAAVEEATLARQLANIDAMIADPLAKVVDWKIEFAAKRIEALDSRSDGIMTAIERAASATGRAERGRAETSGRILARLLADLPRNRFVEYGPRLLALYSKADDEHWLWNAKPLLGRLGDLGPDALPYLTNPRVLRSRVDETDAVIEGLCRIGPAGRADTEPLLLGMWSKSTDRHHDERTAMFVAMRRIGIAPPPLSEDRYDLFAKLQAEWVDVTPQSLSRVCAVAAERQARREEKRHGTRRTNLD